MENLAGYKEYTELNVWLKSRELVNLIYTITANFPQNEAFGLIIQMRRCAVSIPSNIAEGCGRNHSKDTLQFIYIARGSVYELETQTYISFDQKYINEETLNIVLDLISVNKKLINGFINYFQKKI
jgi:four helix bundle protein